MSPAIRWILKTTRCSGKFHQYDWRGRPSRMILNPCAIAINTYRERLGSGSLLRSVGRACSVFQLALELTGDQPLLVVGRIPVVTVIQESEAVGDAEAVTHGRHEWRPERRAHHHL